MIYSISCSYGEIIDKLTILEIKLSKCLDSEQKKNIQNEYNNLSHHKKYDTQFIENYQELKSINMKLWDFEDRIRIKSNLKEYDKEFIFIADGIHKYNDKRYELKSNLNRKYHSYIIEEKIYTI
jgi:uridine kinase